MAAFFCVQTKEERGDKRKTFEESFSLFSPCPSFRFTNLFAAFRFLRRKNQNAIEVISKVRQNLAEKRLLMSWKW